MSEKKKTLPIQSLEIKIDNESSVPHVDESWTTLEE